MRWSGLAVLSLLLAAAAPERPPTVPTRDVAVVYRIMNGPGPIEERMRFRAADQTTRLEIAPQVYMLTDMRAHTATMVNDGDRSAMKVPVPNFDPAAINGANFTKLGTLTVAGVPCTEWQTTDVQGQVVIACLSADGVLLRARHGDHVDVEAASVSFDPQNPATFSVPPGYRLVAPPPRQ